VFYLQRSGGGEGVGELPAAAAVAAAVAV